jgi:hypothetical protein
VETIDRKHKDILGTIAKQTSDRSQINSRWVELWALYKTLPLALTDDTGQWKSKLNDGRVFEVIETIAAYLRSALFFSDSWFSLEANEPELGDVLPLVNSYMLRKINSSNFKREFRIHLRQLLLLGFSGMSVYEEDNELVYECINSVDLYVENSRRFDKNSYAFRRVYLNESLFYDLVEDQTIMLDDEDPEDFWKQHAGEVDIDRAALQSLNEDSNSLTPVLTMVEYWCPIDEVLYRFIGNDCVGEEDLDYCPWLISNLYELPDSAYGLSQLDNSIGLMIENNCIMNRRLDNMALSVDNMWLFVDDGVTNPDDIKSSPGKVLNVSAKDVLTPMYPPTNNFQVTYQESALIDQRIDKNTGTGALVSSGQYRSGDRVTAQEINAVKDAGGNRLTDLYEHLESEFIIPMLMRSLALCRKNSRKAVVKLASSESGNSNYFQLLPEDFYHDYSITVRASQSVINRDRNVRKIKEFIEIVNTVPQFAELVNYGNLYTDILYKFGFDDPQRYIVEAKPEQEAPAPAPTSPMDALMQGAGDIGGAAAQAGVTEAAASGKLGQMLAETATGVPGAVPTLNESDPALAQQQMLAMQQPLPTA